MEINPLGNYDNYNSFLDIYNKNKNKNVMEWLDIDQIFNKLGKQGVVGIFKCKEDPSKKCVFKFSQEIDNLTVHEGLVMESLNDMSMYCPTFCKSYGLAPCIRSEKYVHGEDIFFTDHTNKSIPDEVLLIELIENTHKLSSYIKSTSISDDIIFATMKQVLLSISFAQKHCEMTHYDLHSMNILMKKCDKNLVMLYVIDEDNQLYVPTYGHYPIVIDFGFSYSNNMEDGPLWASMCHTSYGFTSNRFDWLTDAKLFLITMLDELSLFRKKSNKIKKFKKIIEGTFKELDLDWGTGWDYEDEHVNATDKLCDFISKNSKNSLIFSDYVNIAVDLMLPLIILPLEKNNSKNLKKSFDVFIKEWVKIEDELMKPSKSLYMLKQMINNAGYVRSDYMTQETRDDAVRKFKNDTFEDSKNVAKFCQFKTVDFEKLLCSLYIVSSNMENNIYKNIDNKVTSNNYDKLKITNTDQIYGDIEYNINCPYKFTKDTKIMIMNPLSKKSNIFKLDDTQTADINKIHNICKGTLLYEYYKNNQI